MSKGTDKVIAIKRKADAAAKAKAPTKPKAAAPPAAPAPAAKPKEPPAKAAQSVSKGKAAPAAAPAAPTPAKPSRKPLEAAWLGWPKVEKHGLYFHRASDEQLVCFHKFAANYAAKKFMEAAANGEEMKLLPDGTVAFGKYIVSQVIDGQMQELLEHRYTEAEAEWELPQPYDGYARALAGLRSSLEDRVEAMRASAAAAGTPAPAKPPRAASAPRAPRAAASAPRAPRAAGGGKADPYAIRPDMPMSRKVRRTAQRLQMEATGKEDGWQAMKPAAAKLVKDQGL